MLTITTPAARGIYYKLRHRSHVRSQTLTPARIASLMQNSAAEHTQAETPFFALVIERKALREVGCNEVRSI